jgi:hypothetical protein
MFASSVTMIRFLKLASIVLYIKMESASSIFLPLSPDLAMIIIAFAFYTLHLSRSAGLRADPFTI